MLIIRMTEGLGNQMQQYAVCRKLSQYGLDRDVKIDVLWYKKYMGREVDLELRMFPNLPLPICTDAERDTILRGNSLRKVLSKLLPTFDCKFVESEMYHPEIYSLKNKYLEGYFACQMYYDDIMQELQELFCFPNHPDKELHKKNMELVYRMEQECSISLHIRRGDYLWAENDVLFGNIATEAYYESAMNYIRERYTNVHFYVFSDDPEYAKAKYGNNNQYTIIDHNKGRYSLFDIQLMSHCHGNICANSTFSFWGARLNRTVDKVVIRPFMMRNNQRCDPDVLHRYWPEWILIDRNGELK